MNQSLWRRIFAVVTVLTIGTSLYLWFANPFPRSQSVSERNDAASKALAKDERPSSNDFAGSAACIECHQAVSKNFRAHPMGHSLAEMSTVEAIETEGDASRFDLPQSPDLPFHIAYQVERTDTEVIHHEMGVGKDGSTVYDSGMPVRFALGSGQRGRSYLISRDDILLMSPMGWYAQAHRWDLSPGYQTNSFHFGRRIVDGCLSCHSGQVNQAGKSADHFHSDPFIEESIGCERCHGPAKSHVAYRKGPQPQNSSDPILKIGELSSTLQNHVCFQCHLIGEQRITRQGKRDFDFRAGQHLDDVWTFVVRAKGKSNQDSSEAVTQVEQMLSSKCYVKSEGRLKCITCHEPHSRPLKDNFDAHYKDRCATCHNSASVECSELPDRRSSANDSCISCHMPKVDASDVPHMSQTDHRLLKKPGRHGSDPSQPQKYAVFRDRESSISQAELERGFAIGLVRIAEGMNNAALARETIPRLEKWLKANPDDGAAGEALGLEYYLLKDYLPAFQRWSQSLKLAPDNEDLLRRLFILSNDMNQPEQALQYGQRLIKLDPWDFDVLVKYANQLAQKNQLDEAVKYVERALQINPSVANIHEWLAKAYALKGDQEQSERHHRQYEAMSN